MQTKTIFWFFVTPGPTTRDLTARRFGRKLHSSHCEKLTAYYLGEAKGSGWRKVHKVFLIEGYPNLNIGNTSFMSF